MKFNILFLIAVLITSQACSGQKSTTSNQETSVSNSLKKRPSSPPIKVKREFMISAKGAEPFILTETNYDKKGNVLLVKSFDFYGSGEQDGSVKSEYSEEGNLISKTQVSDGQSTFYNYKYNSKNQKIEESWKRENGQGEITKYSYDKKGNELELKYFKLDGKHDFSRVYEYEYDSKGNIISEKKWEKYTDGYADLLQYHINRVYENDQLKSITHLTDKGKPRSMEEYKYDENGLKVATIDSSSSGSSKEVFVYNEYREVIENKTGRIMKDGSKELDIHSKTTYDKYGNTTGYIYLKGSIDSYGTKFEYEFH